MKKEAASTSSNMNADKVTIAQIKSGNEREKDKAFTELYKRYFNNLMFYIMPFVNMNRELAEDCTQEVFAKVFTKIDQYNEEFAFSTWLYKIARNHMTDTARNSEVEVFSIEALKTGGDGDEDTTERMFQLADQSIDSNVVEQIARQDRKTVLLLAIESMKNEKQKELIKARFFDELSYEEAVEKLGLPIGTVKALINRGKAEIKEFLLERGFDESIYRPCTTAKFKQEVVEIEE